LPPTSASMLEIRLSTSITPGSAGDALGGRQYDPKSKTVHGCGVVLERENSPTTMEGSSVGTEELDSAFDNSLAKLARITIVPASVCNAQDHVDPRLGQEDVNDSVLQACSLERPVFQPP
jgi:hypothetical protein